MTGGPTQGLHHTDLHVVGVRGGGEQREARGGGDPQYLHACLLFLEGGAAQKLRGGRSLPAIMFFAISSEIGENIICL